MQTSVQYLENTLHRLQTNKSVLFKLAEGDADSHDKD